MEAAALQEIDQPVYDDLNGMLISSISLSTPKCLPKHPALLMGACDSFVRFQNEGNWIMSQEQKKKHATNIIEEGGSINVPRGPYLPPVSSCFN